MKLATFQSGGTQRIGAVLPEQNQIVDLQAVHQTVKGAASPDLAAMQRLIEGGDAALAVARAMLDKRADAPGATLDLKATKLMAPVPVPASIRDGIGYELHAKQAANGMRKLQAKLRGEAPPPDIEKPPEVWYKQPLYYKGNRLSVIGPGDDILWPDYAVAMDYECEFGIFMKGTSRNIKPEDAQKHVFGYVIFNDVSARCALGKEVAAGFGPAKGKDFDTSNVMGPWIATADEVPDPYNLTMVVRINGTEKSRGHSSTMYWTLEKMLPYVSRSETLHPGEFIGLGTVGNGCGLERSEYLEPGDVIEIEIDGLGTLRNRIVKPA